jgi:hypothetical protein
MASIASRIASPQLHYRRLTSSSSSSIRSASWFSSSRYSRGASRNFFARVPDARVPLECPQASDEVESLERIRAALERLQV